jgi:RHS repeat-associated protein
MQNSTSQHNPSRKQTILKHTAFWVLLCFFLSINALKAQDLLWKANMGGSNHNYPFKSVIDSQNNIYVLGTFNGSLNVPNNLITKGSNDVFVAKYDPNGGLLWVKQIGSNADDFGTGITVSPDNNFIYVTGVFQNNAYADNIMISSTGGYDGFLAKYDKDGNIIRFKSIASGTGVFTQRPMEIKLDNANHLIVGGYFKDNLTLGDATKSYSFTTASTQTGFFISQFDTAGIIITAKKFEAESGSMFYSLDVDNNGYYLCGYYKGNFVTDLPTKTSINNSLDMFIYKVDNNLTGQWIANVGGSGSEFLTSSSVDNQGNFYFGGYFYSPTLTVDSTGMGNHSLRTAINKISDGSTSDVFFAKYNSSGILQWFNTAGSNGNDILYRALYKNSNFIVAGQYGGTLTFNNQTITTKGNGDAFAIVSNSSNTKSGLISVGGSGADIGETALIDNLGNYILIGDYTSPKIYFSNGDSLINSNSGTKDMFVAKYKGILPQVTLRTVITNPICAGDFTGAVNITPEGTFSAPLTFVWSKTGDASFTATTKDITGLNAGTYVVNVTDASGYTKTDSVTLTDPAAMNLSATITNVTCENGASDGKITLNAPVNGQAPYSYQWNNGLYTPEITSLGIGSYTVTVTDSIGCKAMFSASLVYGSPIVSHISVTDVNPPENPAGSADLGITGGYPPFTYQWNNGATSSGISGVAAGRYYATVTDSKQCKKNYDIRINNLTLNAYLPPSQVPDAETRQLDTSLDMGATEISAGVSPSGASSFTIPVKVPSGIAGMEPHISVSYNGQSGNGLVGWGCSLTGLSSVNRTIATIYSDGNAKGLQLTTADPFVWDGNRLVVTSGTNGADNSGYATENETFAKIVAHGNHSGTGPEWFQVTARNGTKFTYGLNQNSKLLYDDNSGANRVQAILAWYLDYAEDLYGNFITYTYEQDGLYTYVKKITYGNNRNSDTHNNNTIEFTYAQRNDPIPVHYGKQKGSIDQLLYSIVVKNNNSVFRTYKFDYTSDVYTRLVSVTESNSNGEKRNPVVFKWGHYNTGPLAKDSIVVTPSLYKGFGDQYYTSADVNGDGLDDLIGFFPYDYSCGPGCTSNTTAIEVYTASRAADSSYHFTPDGIPYELGPNINLDFKSYITGNTSGDVDGDGKKEIITSRYSYMDHIGPQVHFNILKNGGQHPIGRDLIASSEMPVYAIGDLNNDGIDEIVFIEKGTSDNLNYPGQIAYFRKDKWLPLDIHQRQSVPVKVPLVGTVYIQIKPERMFISDFDGDGLQDIMVLDPMGYMIYKNTQSGDNFWFTREASGAAFTSNYLIQQGDFNGDGLPDFIMNKKGTDNGEWYLALNDGKMGFTMVSLPGIHVKDDKDTDKDNDKDNIIVTDFNNDGKSDVIIVDATYDDWEHSWGKSWKSFTGMYTYWYKSTGEALELLKTTFSSDAGDAYNQFFITGDFNGDGHTDLINYGYDCNNQTSMERTWRLYDAPGLNGESGAITCIANSFNVRTKFGYKSLTDKNVYTTTTTSAYPLTTITAPLFVVSELKTDNGVSGKGKVSYSYEDATIHRQGKGFLGFGKIAQTDSVTSNSSFATTAFNTSCFTVARQTTETFAGSTKTVETVNEFATDTLGGRRIFVHPASSRSTDLLKNITVSTLDTFDTGGNLTSQTTSYNSDFYSIKKIFSSIDSLGNPGHITTKTIRKGEPAFTSSQSITYNEHGKPASATADNLTTRYTYDTYGNQVSVTLSTQGMDDRKDSSVYDPTGRFVEKEVNALGFVTGNSYNNIGNLLSQKDINGLETTNTYNAWGKPTETISSDGKKSTVAHKWVAPGDPAAPAYALYYTESYNDGKFAGAEYFDKAGHSLRKVSTGFDGAKYYTDYTYNAQSQVTETTEAYPANSIASRKTSYTYDGFGRILTETLPDGVIKTYTYTDAKNKVETDYSTGEHYAKTYDATGLVSLSTDPGGDIAYQYTSAGKTRRIESPGSVIRITYDTGNRRDTLIDPNAGTITYKYNAFGEIISQKDGRGKTDTMVYDKLGRVTVKTTEGVSTTYTYDAPGALGFVKSISSHDKAGSAYTYDALGRITSETRSKDNGSLTYKYAYDSAGRVSKLTYPAGFAVKYTYNNHNDLTEIRDTLNHLIWKIDEVNVKGQLTHATYGNQKQVEYGYDDNDRLNHISVPGIISFNYQFNNKQQLDYREEKYWVNDTLKGFRESFTYDNVNRLLTAAGTNTLVMAYTSGVNDRIRSKSDIGVYMYQDGNHRIDEIDSLKGYLPADHYLAYTKEGKIDTISEGGKLLTFVYGIDNQRFSSTYTDSASSYTRYYFDNYEKELNSDGSLRHHLNYIFAGNTLVAIYEQKPTAGSMHYVYTDYLGSLRCITDANGIVEQRLGYDAWGNRRDPITGAKLSSVGGAGGGLTPRGFTFHEHLDEFALINMNGRVYDPALGMFLSPDNYVQMPDFTQNFNRYAYGLNNPMCYVDPDGNNPLLIAALIIGLVGGTANMIAHWDQIHSFGDGAAAFGIGFGGGVLGTLAFGTPAGGFFAYAMAGATSYITSTSFTSIGNTGYFGDPMPTPEEFIKGTVISMGVSGVMGGLTSMSNGNNFWTDDPIVAGRSAFSFNNRPFPMNPAESNTMIPIKSNVAPQINTAGMRATPLQISNAEEGLYVLDDAKTIAQLSPGSDAINYLREPSITYRANLVHASGFDPGPLARAHHPFPVEYAEDFAKAGVRVNRYGTWWETVSHGQFAKAYNAAWGEFFLRNPNPTKLEIYNELIRLKGIFGF